MKTKHHVSWVLASLLIGSTALLAESGDYSLDMPSAWKEVTAHKVKHTDNFGDIYYTDSYKEPKSCVTDAVKKYSEPVNKAPKEVLEGLKATLEADRALRLKQDKRAEQELERAQAQFQAAFKAKPELKWIPVDVDIVVNSTEASNKSIAMLLKEADAAISEHRTQEARELLLPLKDEIDVTTLYLPVEAYADAVQKSLKALQAKNHFAASQALATAFGLMVSERIVIPIALLSAEALIAEAAALGKPRKKEATELLDEALDDLQRAELLGYTGKHSQDYNDLSRQIREVRKVVDGGGSGDKLYHALKKDFGKLLDAIEGEIPFVGS